MTEYTEQLWNLDEVHDLIERDPVAGGREAVNKIIHDVQVITDKISDDVEKGMARVYIEAEMTATKIKAEAKEAASTIREDAAKAAADLIANVKEGEDPKAAAAIAEKIIKQAEKNSADLNRQADETIKALTDQAEDAAFNFQRIAETQVRHVTQLQEQATKKLADTTKEMAAKYLDPGDGMEDKEGRQAAAEIIKILARASDEVHNAATEISAKIQEATEQTLTTVRAAARDAAASIESAIGDANNKMLEVTQTTVTQTVGAEAAEFYELGSLRDKIKNRPA